jgi:hypothetical protein
MALQSLACALFLLIPTGCSRSPDSGAKIAEPAETYWRWVCRAHVMGPTRKARTVHGKSRHGDKTTAQRMARTDACRRSSDNKVCMAKSSRWQITKDTCLAKNPAKPKTSYECSISIIQPAMPRKTSSQGEGQTQEAACRRATMAACRTLAGGLACTHLQTGWTREIALGRYDKWR